MGQVAGLCYIDGQIDRVEDPLFLLLSVPVVWRSISSSGALLHRPSPSFDVIETEEEEGEGGRRGRRRRREGADRILSYKKINSLSRSVDRSPSIQ